MAKPKNTSQEFIRDSFCPHIGILCSPISEDICKKNNLTFIELLQPFCRLSTEVSYRDSNGTPVQLKNLKVTLQDVRYKSPPYQLARKYLSQSVSDAVCPKSQPFKVGENSLDIPSGVPWFNSWRETFFQMQQPSDHEFTKHFLACMMVVSTSEPNVLDGMQQLTQTLNHLQGNSSNLLKWFNGMVLRYYVLLHENTGNDNIKADEIFEAIKTSYGDSNCFLLKINSRGPTCTSEQLPDPWSQFISNVKFNDSMQSPNSPNASPEQDRAFEAEPVTGNSFDTLLRNHPLSPDLDGSSLTRKLAQIESEKQKLEPAVLHGGCLTTDDLEQIKLLIHDMCTKALVPYVERQILLLSDFVANKKGVSKSLFSATKRWFTQNKPTSNATATNILIYPPDAPELQIRRLADLYFIFGHYGMAFQAYHTAKREFMTDQAWLYYAGALEMAALAAFMNNDSSKKTFDYMEESITTYLNTCKMTELATRSTLLSIECLKCNGLYGEAAHQLIRMTSEESDLRSALLLEQASYCFLMCPKPQMVRKYAFHMVLAGHRFTKASQRKHSLRCYKQAHEIYKSKGWNLAEDHIHYTIGKLASNLQELEEAIVSYTNLLTGESKQTSQQQAMFLKEYLITKSALLKEQNAMLLQTLPLPIVQSETIKVLVGPVAPLRTPGKVPAVGVCISTEEDTAITQKWNKLEELLVQEAQGSLPLIFKPMVTLFTNKNVGTVNPVAFIGEPIQVAVELHNPLQIILHLKEVNLLWSYKDNTNRIAVNEIVGHNLDHLMKTHYIKSVVIQANSTQEVVLSITPLAVGSVVIRGICYSLVSAENEIALRGKQMFNITGPKVRKKDEQQLNYGIRLDVSIVPSASCLQVSFSKMNSELLRNEMQEVAVELRNTGSIPLHKIYMATSTPHLLSSCEFQEQERSSSRAEGFETESVAAKEREARKNHVSRIPNCVLAPGQHINFVIWLKAPEVIGPALIDLLFYYEDVAPSNKPRYRLVRHVWMLSIQESIRVELETQDSSNSKKSQQLALIVKAINLNRIHHAILTEITLLKAAMLSDNWTLLNQFVAPENIKLESQESVFILLKLCRRKASNNYSEVSFRSISESKTDHAYLDFARRVDRNRLNIFDDLNSKSSKRDATLILRWQALVTDSLGHTRLVNGQNHLPVNIIALEESAIEALQGSNYSFDRSESGNTIESSIMTIVPKERQVTYNLLHQPIVWHNFNGDKLCHVPIKLIIRSIVNTRLVVEIDTCGSNCSQHSAQLKCTFFCTQCSRSFRWSHAGNIIRTLEPLSSTDVNLSVAVLYPGAYDLGSYIELRCHNVDQPETTVLQNCHVQSSLIVMDANNS